MRVLPRVLLVLWVSSAVVVEDAAAQEDTSTLWAALRAGGHVALVRHGATAGGAGDPPGFRLDDCATQRSLTDKGRAEARRLGEQFRSEDVAGRDGPCALVHRTDGEAARTPEGGHAASRPDRNSPTAG